MCFVVVAMTYDGDDVGDADDCMSDADAYLCIHIYIASGRSASDRVDKHANMEYFHMYRSVGVGM